MVTSNHIHLLAVDGGDRDVLPRSLQLVAGRTGQEYNQRKNRKGAFWEDRYHATAIENGEHFVKCMVYIDLNMVRAGVVDHPSEWPDCGYREIQNPPQRYALIDRQKLSELAMLNDIASLKESHAGWLHEKLPSKSNGREDKWTNSIAIGGEKFVFKIKKLLGVKATGRKVVNMDGMSELREPSTPYNANFIPENDPLRVENLHYWNIYHNKTSG